MNDYHQLLEEAVRAITIHSATTYSWFGKPSARLPARLKRALTPRDARNYLLYTMTSQLYSDFYIRGMATPSVRGSHPVLQTGLTPFVAELSAANAGNGYWEDGWQVRTIERNRVSVFHGDLTVWANLEDLLAKDGPLAPAMAVPLRFPKELLSISPGFYMVLSDKPFTHDDGELLIRVYWNLTAEGAVPFVRVATTLLNKAGLPFKLKVARDPALFTRCDAAVVYIRKCDYHIAADILNKVYADISMYLKPGTPVFTKPLARGVGLAEDPGLGESFGQNRCHLIADAVVRAYEQGKKSAHERLQVAAERFAEENISLTEPFLNPGSQDDYPLFPHSFQRLAALPEVSRTPHFHHGDETLLRTADELGWRLSREAVWHSDQCNWVGAEPMGRDYREPLTYKALRPELYTGTSGVALFLAELYAASGTSEARRTASGAMHQALDHAASLSLQSRLSFYTGSLGIAFASAQVGTLLGEPELQEHAAQLLRECIHAHQEEGRELDLLSGDAGAIIALLLLREMLDDADLLVLAVGLGDRLLLSADNSCRGVSWKSPRFQYPYNLTGFSHGAAGIGYALLELFQATGDTKYRATAERAFEYERSWFDAEKGNWPDFREAGKPSKKRQLPQTFATFWCHGAPGIGLARLRAYEMLNDASYKNEAGVALRTTATMLQAALHTGNGNFSLCHGLTGNAEALLYGHQVLGQEWADTSALAFEVAEVGIETAKRQGGAWSCGIETGEAPGLLLGLAGIGYFYLRLYDPAIPSILIPKREDFSLKTYRKGEQRITSQPA